MKGERCSVKLLIILALMTASVMLSGCTGKKEITSVDQLNDPDVTIGVAADTAEFKIVEENFPKAKIKYFKEEITAYTSVSQGKIDAFVFNRIVMQTAIHEGLEGVRLLDEDIGDGNVSAVAFSPKTKIPDLEGKVNQFLKEAEKDGTLADMEERWIDQYAQEMPDIPEPENPKWHLVVGTTGVNAPFTFFVGEDLRGYDIELAKRFASWLGASIEFKVYDYASIVAAAQSGEIDCIFSNLFITPERQEAIRFSDPTYVAKVTAMVRDDGSGASEAQEYTSLSDFKGKRIGAATGAIQGPAVEREIPDAEVSYFDTHADMLTALRQGKIDAYADSDLIIRYMMIDNEDLTYLDENLIDPVEIGAIFSKTSEGDRLRGEFNDFLAGLKKDGTLDKLDDIWYGSDESLKTVKDISELSAENGVLRLAIDPGTPPICYVSNNQIVGKDIDIAVRFCEAYGYGLEIVSMNFSGLVDAIVSGKCDFGIGGIAITEERAESVNFSDPMYTGNSVIAYLKTDSNNGGGSFLASFKESFHKTFIRENRWKLFLSGIGTTLLITILSILLGTLLGFMVFMICRKGSRAANSITRFCVWLIQGMPVVVLLMILYYIIFSEANISGTAVSVVAFTLIFGASVFSMLKSGVGAVDTGQTEAAYSLGFTDRRAFFRVVLPQAMPHFMPEYKGQVTALIKATAVVGYVAVQDLTKMGDIVRSRTYEAFFPLVAVAVIYFVLAAILTNIVNRIELRTDPRKRTREQIMKETGCFDKKGEEDR